ncbi:hypothetical protein IAU60_002289 [Kwoniella sp. DSM 27419]
MSPSSPPLIRRASPPRTLGHGSPQPSSNDTPADRSRHRHTGSAAATHSLSLNSPIDRAAPRTPPSPVAPLGMLGPPAQLRQSSTARSPPTGSSRQTASAHGRKGSASTGGNDQTSSAGSGRHKTPAEVYADKHTLVHPRKPTDKEKDKEKPTTTKPIFDWIQRKLGTRRATISEAPAAFSSKTTGSSPRPLLPVLPKPSIGEKMTRPSAARAGGRSNARAAGHGLRRDDSSSSMSRIDSRSIATRSVVGTVERERRREANNPYPSIPIPRLAAAGMLHGNSMGQGDDQTTISMSLSMSYLSRSPRSHSRSHSLDSFPSDLNGFCGTDGDEAASGRLSLLDENEPPVRRFRGVEADDDASLRPFPPSHPGSPTPSTSAISRSGSNPILPGPPTFPLSPNGPRSRTNTFYSTWSGQERRSHTSSSLDDYAFGVATPSMRGYSGPVRRSSGQAYGHQDRDREDEDRRRSSRQDSTSTKPTTCISLDSSLAIGHIAQVPLSYDTHDQGGHTPTIAVTTDLGQHASLPSSLISHRVQPDNDEAQVPNASVTVYPSADGSVHTSPTPTPITPTSLTAGLSSRAAEAPDQDTNTLSMLQAPKHTNPHPVHNPRPSSPPGDDASILTLASSNFALPASSSISQGIPSTGISEATPVIALAKPIWLSSEVEGPASESLQAPQNAAASSSRNEPAVGPAGMASPPSINRLREPVTNRPDSIRAPSIHWAPVPSTSMDDRDRASINETGGYAGSTHLSNAPSVAMSMRQWSLADRGNMKADRDASVRAVRRKGSWESYESGWSWRGGGGPSAGDLPYGQVPIGGAWTRNLASPVPGDEGAEAAERGGSLRGSTYARESWLIARNEVGEDGLAEREGAISPAALSASGTGLVVAA